MKPHLNRIITGFLLLSILATSVAYLLSNHDSESSTNKTANNTTEENKPLSGKAFVETLPKENLLQDDIFARNTSTDLTALIPTIKISPKTNLTDAIAQQLAYKLVEENPQGPQPGSNGLLPMPDVQNILKQLAASGIAEQGNLPDWEAETISLPVLVQENYTLKDIDKYVIGFNNLAQKYIGNTKLEEQFQDESGDPTLALTAFDALQVELKKLPTPKPLVGVQWSFMKLVYYQQKALQAITKEDDPMRMALTIESQAYNYELAGALFKDEIEKANELPGVALLEGSSHLALGDKVLSFLGLPTAHAILGVGDITLVSIDNLRREIFQFIKDKAVQILKDRLIKRVIQDTLNWVNSDFKGKPKFVTNWKQYLGDAANSFAGAAIKKFTPELCQPFSLQLRLRLEQINLTDEKPTCTIDKVVQNVKAFYEDFSQGGWIAYSSTVLPSGNYFGQLDIAIETVAAQTQKTKETKKTEAASGQGFLPTEKCVVWNDKNCPTLNTCLENLDPNDPAIFGKRLTCNMTQACPPNPVVPICVTKEATTLGKIIGTATDNTQNKDLDRIIKERDWKTLLQMFARASLNRLVAKGVEGVAGLFSEEPGACEGAKDEKDCLLKDVCKEFINNKEEYASCTGTWKPVTCNLTPQSAGNVTATGGTGGAGGSTGSGSGDPTCQSTCESQCTAAGQTDCANSCAAQCTSSGGSGGTGGRVDLSLTARSGNCTGGIVGLASSTTSDCEMENCPVGCLCKCRDSVTSGDFCFLGVIAQAQAAVEAAGRADGQGGATVGMMFGEEAITFCGADICVRNIQSGVYQDAIKAEMARIAPGVTVTTNDGGYGEEIGMSGTCPDGRTTCSKTRPDVCISGERGEGTAVVSSGNRVRIGVPNAICPGT